MDLPRISKPSLYEPRTRANIIHINTQKEAPFGVKFQNLFDMIKKF